MRTQIEYGIPAPRRGPKYKYAGKFELDKMKPGGSIYVEEVEERQRTPKTITVQNSVNFDVERMGLTGEYKVGSRKVSDGKCEIRIWRNR